MNSFAKCAYTIFPNLRKGARIEVAAAAAVVVGDSVWQQTRYNNKGNSVGASQERREVSSAQSLSGGKREATAARVNARLGLGCANRRFFPQIEFDVKPSDYS